ncbi:MAG: hypothetical protein ABJB11_07600 [Ferruginibacter sp.]
MGRERLKFFILLSIIVIVFFIIPYFLRKAETADIAANSKFAMGKIIRLTRTLKSGKFWHYQFKYKNIIFENSQSTHVDYDVNLGDYFLVNFSTKNPEHSEMFYKYKLAATKQNYVDSTWNTIPEYILTSGLTK